MIVDETAAHETIELQELDSSSIIHQFTIDNNLVGLEELLSQGCVDIDKRNEDNQTSLHVACINGNSEMVAFLVDKGASVLARDNNDFTPFMLACYGGHLECAVKTHECHPSVDQVDMNGWSSLVWAAYKGHTEIVNFLLNQKANLHLSVSYNMTSLLLAAGRGHSSIVEILCYKGAKVNHVDKFGNTALIWASRRGYFEIVECLLQFDSDPNIIGPSGCSCLINAVKGDHIDCVRKLLRNTKLNVNQADQSGHTPLNMAAKQGSVELTTLLLDRGAYLNLADHHGDTPLIKAVKYGHLETVKVLLSRFADVDIRGKDDKTALHIACETGQVAIIKELLNCGCKIECLNGNKETPLVRSVKEGNLLVTKTLLANGADVSAHDQNHDTCIHLAIRQQNLQLVELLLRNPKHGRFMYQENKAGQTPYDIDMHGNKKILAQLFGSKGFSAAAVNTDSTFDASSCSLAEMLTEPMLETPICIGLYSKWGSDVTLLLNKIKDQMELFACSLPALALRGLSWLTLFLNLYVASTIAVLMSFIFPQRELAGSLTFVFIFASTYSVILLVHLGALYRKWPWAKAANRKFKENEMYFKLIAQICFLRFRAPTSGGKVRFIFAGCMNLASIKEEEMISGITATLLRSVESSTGKVALRLARTLPTDSMDSDQKFIFRKACCFPLFILFVGCVFGSTAIILLVVAVYGPAPVLTDPTDTFRVTVTLCVLAIIIGGVLVLSLPTLAKVFVSLFHSPKRIQKTLGCELNSNKTEVHNLSKALAVIDSINKTKTRICLLINGLETSDQTQLAQLVHSVRSIYATHPIIVVMCIDYQLVSTAVKQSSFCFFNSGDIKEDDYMQHVIQIPIFLPDKKRRKRFIAPPENFDSDTDENTHSLNKRKKYPKHFDVTKWLTSDDCFQPVDPLLIKRVASIISFTARLLRSGEKDFSWSNLSAWIVLTELWAYSTTCLICYIGKKSIPQNRSLKSLYLEVKHLFANNQSGDVCDAYSLQRFITSKSCGLTVSDVISFHHYTVNLDPVLEDLIPTYSETWGVQSNSQHAASTAMSSNSNLSYDDVPLCDWTVEDVCFRIKAIPGLDTTNFQHYSTFVHKNNFHGLALSLCDLDELKKELKTSFGDWCLIKKFIAETRATSVKAKQLSFSSLASNDKKPSETGTLPEIARSEDIQHLSSLASSDRVAYNKAFKEYLKLQPQTSSAIVSHNDAHNAIVHAQLDNENVPLLSVNLDVNAN